MVEAPASLVSEIATRHGRTVQREVGRDFYRVTLQAMSTPVRLIFRASRELIANDFQRSALQWLALFEARYSRFQNESIVSEINGRAGGDWLELDDEADAIFSLCDEMYRLSLHTFDAAMLPLLKLWNWKAQPARLPNQEDVRSALSVCGWEKVERRPHEIRLPVAGMGIDLGGIGKEYAVDQLIALAPQHGITDVMVDIGQDLRVCGHPPGKPAWMIGLEEPATPGKCWTAVALNDRAVATSGDYFRSFTRDGKRYGHILDPRTGYPVSNGCQAVSVIAQNCVLAGVLSTAAFILGDDEGLALIRSQPDVEACITTESARHQTRRFSTYVPI